MMNQHEMTLRRAIALLGAVAIVFLGACSDDSGGSGNGGQDDVGQDTGADAQPDAGDTGGGGATQMRFEPAGEGFFDVPFPSDVRLIDGAPGLHEWARAYEQPILKLWFDAADDLLDGWGLVSGVFVNFDAPIDPATLPQTVAGSTSSDPLPSVFLADVDADSPEAGRLLPIECKFTAAEGTYHDANQLGCISPFGVVRRPRTTYALVVTTAVTDAAGHPVAAAPAMRQLLDGQDVAGRDGTVAAAPYAEAMGVLGDLGLTADDVAGLALFTTGEPTERVVRIAEWYRELPEPQINADSLEFVEELDDYVVLRATYDVPVIQQGELPYSAPPAGEIVWDAAGEPVEQGSDTVPFLLTIPKTTMPDGGFPVLMYMHGSGGEAQELIDRGARPDPDTAAPHGSGPGGVVAPYGIAGFAAEFPMHGTRYSPPDTTGMKLYNLLGNPRATVDNFLISANEVELHARLLAGLTVDPAIAPEGVIDAGAAADGLIRFDADRLTAMGQSMGSTIGLPALTISHEIDAGILSGSGGTLIEVALESTKPLNIKRALIGVLRYREDEAMDRFDPLLNALQHVWDYVDPVVHARHAIHEPHPGVPAKHILQHSGVDDGYFSLESRTALSGALGVDFVEPVLEDEALELMGYSAPDHATPLALPVQANLGGQITGVVTMYEPSVLDGHNVAYQRDDAKAQYACFAKTVGGGTAPELRGVAAAETCE